VPEGRHRTRDDIIAAHAEGTVRRLRPKVMTIATIAAGLLPLLWADGGGLRRRGAPGASLFRYVPIERRLAI
jgi:multidrug efflux pump subunit AcrB